MLSCYPGRDRCVASAQSARHMQGGGMHRKVASQAMIEVGDRSVCQIVVSSLIRSVFTLLKCSSHVYNLPIVCTNLLPFLALTQMVHFLPLFCSFQCFVIILFFCTTHLLSPVRLKCSKIASKRTQKHCSTKFLVPFDSFDVRARRMKEKNDRLFFAALSPFSSMVRLLQCAPLFKPSGLAASSMCTHRQSQPASLLPARTERPRINLCPRPNTTSAPIGRECIAQHAGWCLLYFISISLASNTASHRVPIHKHYHRGA